MSITIVLAVLLLVQFGLTGVILWRRHRSNRDLFKTDAPRAPVRTNSAYFGAFTGLYDFLDRIPILRRSGRANEFDLLKAMLIISVPTLLIQLLVMRASLLVSLIAAHCVATMINATLLAHPALKRIAGK